MEVATVHGANFVVERRYPTDTRRGAPIGHLAAEAASAAGRVDRRRATGRARPGRARELLDTETTGLAGGTGTYAFLVGPGLVEDGEFVVRQFFLRGLGEERAMLAHLAEHLRARAARHLQRPRPTGRCSTTRFTLAERAALPGLPHRSVSPMARRLWRSRLGRLRPERTGGPGARAAAP